ncbi:acyl-[acyl-carrier-protein] thioesterase [Pontiella agarivorans]|uniref:Thioesterase n=1 Tax=Pontiella agarivorans TaxID=3038953 RepID=A0ABU5MW43_9BACT|nr:acyl-ACP thioesterase domain-containing protein [Pontiella agarivorans]MDZ8118306.1 thioesterase [Pontiella agarivorans]
MIKDVWETEFEIRSYDVDTNCTARLAVFCRFMQEAAYLHAEHFGLGHTHLAPSNMAWVLARMRLEIERLPKWGERVTLRTWPSGRDRLFYYRDFEFTDAAGETILLASTAWFVIDYKKRVRVSPDWWTRADFPAGRKLFDSKLSRLKTCGCTAGSSMSVNYGDLDQNGHVSNIRYVEWIMNNLSLEFHQSHRILALEVNYLSEAVYGQEVSICQLQDGHLINHGIMAGGEDLFRAQTKWKTI